MLSVNATMNEVNKIKTLIELQPSTILAMYSPSMISLMEASDSCGKMLE